MENAHYRNFFSFFNLEQTALWREQNRISNLELNIGTESDDPETVSVFLEINVVEKKNSSGIFITLVRLTGKRCIQKNELVFNICLLKLLWWTSNRVSHKQSTLDQQQYMLGIFSSKVDSTIEHPSRTFYEHIQFLYTKAKSIIFTQVWN